MADLNKKIEISLNLMPSFFTKHAGIKYGQAYYFDPVYREKVEATENNLIRDILADYGVNKEKFIPSANIFMQPVELILKTQGAKWQFPEDATLESVGTPWANLKIEEIDSIDPQEAANHKVIKDIINQYNQMEKLYGERADIFWVKSGIMNIHTPYTTAHQLCGENLFILMLTDPKAVEVIFEKIWDIYKAIFNTIKKTIGAGFSKIQLGDCSASMLSPDVYRNVVAPFNLKIARQFSKVGYHSCGPSTHLLGEFTKLPVLESIQLGPGTNIASATKMMPNTTICPLVDPVVMRNGNSDAVEEMIGGIIHDTQEAKNKIICAWSFDRETPFDNIRALYKTVKKIS